MMKKSITEREINLIDMFWAVCLKWRQMLVVGIIFAILGAGFSYIRGAQNVKDGTETAEKVALDELEATLEKTSKENAEMYLEYVEMYNEQLKYNELSPIMQLDAGGFYRSVITYSVDNYFSVEYPLMNKTNNITAMLEAYESEMKNQDFSEKIGEILELDKEAIPYVLESIECNNSLEEINYNNNAYVGIITISICNTDEQVCKELSKLVKDTITSKKENVTERVGEHKLTLIGDVCNFEADNDILIYQKQNLDKLITYFNVIEDMKEKFSADELAYVEAYANDVAEDMVGEETIDDVVDSASIVISKKIIVLGFFAGVIVVCFIAVCMYLINNRVRLEDEFEMLYEIKLLGNVVVKREKKNRVLGFIDDYISKMRHHNQHYFEEGEAVSMVAAGIKIGARKLNTSKVYITGATMGNEEKNVIEKLKKELKKANVELVMGKPILYDAEAFEELAEIGYVVLLERAGVSLYSEVVEEIEVCAHQGTKILGAVVVA